MKQAARVGAIVMALLLPAAVAACGKKEVATVQPPRTVRVTSVQVRPMTAALTTSGVLTPREEAAVASELSGYRVATVHVDQGAWVKQGQPLVQLDDTLLRSQIEAQRVAAERADREAARVQGLDNQGVLSQEDIENRRFQARAARANLNDLLVRQSRMTIRAPVGGVVLERTVRPGDLSGGAAAPMFRLARGGLIEAAAEVPEADLFRLRPGAAASVVLPDGSRLTGTVRLVSPEVDQQTKLGQVRVLLPVSPLLRSGGFARVEFAGLSRTAPVVPEKAVTFDAEGAFVMTVNADNKVSRAAVKTGARAGGYVELLQGPPPGSRVITSGSSFVLEGDTVRPTADAPALTKAAS
jgi:HlyD family secretion protein